MPILRLISSSSHAEVNRELSSKMVTDKENEYAVYHDNGSLVSSTFSGGANPHAWDSRASGKSRKLSGLRIR